MSTDPAGIEPTPNGSAPRPKRRAPWGCLFRLVVLAGILGAIAATVWILKGQDFTKAFEAIQKLMETL